MMDYRYDLQHNTLFADETEIPAYSLEKNEIGICSTCDSALFSISYHSSASSLIVACRCISCGSFYANIYDSEWNWLDEVSLSLLPIPIQISSPAIQNLKELEAIPVKKLEAVFSKGEIEALFARARSGAPVRQYLYRARKKYDLFDELFELRLEF